MSIEVRDVTRRFGAFTALDRVSLRFPAGELTALLGPSGSGKTSLLRIIAGLETPDAGSVLFEDEDATRRDARDRRVGFVFQHYALFRHLTVFENVAFGLRVRPRRLRPPEAEIRARVLALLRLVQLDWLADRHPGQLSGGQRQRVALVRALAVEPKVLLLDEPFGSLDARVRVELRRWLRRLHDEIRLTSVFVTHDQEEALEVADRLVVMNHGRVEQVGTPQEVFDHPATPFVLGFLGEVNALADGYARPHEVELLRHPEGATGLWATVRHVGAGGALLSVELVDDAGRPLRAALSAAQARVVRPMPGERLFLSPRRLHSFGARPPTAHT